ncbi:MAG TPA: lipocalin-like domain-containing protein [Gammaproteobacteria bacterium]|nr:lipocalin-like domain-containing protein [Gammaproteobacteria bacterium]
MRSWLALLVALTACSAQQDDAPAPVSSGLRYLGGVADSSFARATEPREFRFPADHGGHPEFQTEWWYLTGNLATADGRHFGFELTFFRYAVAAGTSTHEGASAWRADQIWMAHFAITDTKEQRFLTAERLSRQALGLAGVTTEPLRVWVKDWSLEGGEAAGRLELQAEARDENMELVLELTAARPPVAHGAAGLSHKGATAGNASYYYSVPRLEARGRVGVEGATFTVTGSAWLDREWSTSSLEPGIVGWDWFALHISDGASLMFYRLRTANGESSPYSSGSYVSPAGARTELSATDVALTPLDHWTSRTTGTRYPTAWRLLLASQGLDLEIRPYLQHQEVDLSVRYWEGAVHADGSGAQGRVTAQGYLELAGY